MRIAPATIIIAALLGSACNAGVFHRLDAGLFSNGLSADGNYVLGYSPLDGGRAMRWSFADGVDILGTLGGTANAQASSADGSIVGGSSIPSGFTWRAYRWTQDTGMVNLGAPGEEVRGVSADGSVMVGTLRSPAVRAFRWTEDTGFVDLGLLAGATSARAYGVSADGSVIVGHTQGGFTPSAFRWTEDTGMTSLGFIDGASRAEALAVNADGSVIVGSVGSNWFEPTETRQAFRWTEDTGMVGLGVLDGFHTTSATAVSADGSIIVGAATTQDANTQHAFVWTEDLGLLDLNDFLPTLGYDLGGWTLETVTGISADGTVLTGAARLDENTARAYIITGFLPTPGAASLFVIAGAVASRRRR